MRIMCICLPLLTLHSHHMHPLDCVQGAQAGVCRPVDHLAFLAVPVRQHDSASAAAVKHGDHCISHLNHGCDKTNVTHPPSPQPNLVPVRPISAEIGLLLTDLDRCVGTSEDTRLTTKERKEGDLPSARRQDEPLAIDEGDWLNCGSHVTHSRLATDNKIDLKLINQIVLFFSLR